MVRTGNEWQEWYGKVRTGMERRGAVRKGMAGGEGFGAVWSVTVRFGVVTNGRIGQVRYGVVRWGNEWQEWNGAVRKGVDR